MYEPNYNITDRTARYLAEVAEARAIILNAPLVPKWEVDLRRQAVINSTFASTSIEGNQLTREQVSDLMVGREITATARDKKEVMNYFEALGKLDELAHGSIEEQDILTLHAVVTKDVLDDPTGSGAYRTKKQEKERGRVVVAERRGGLNYKVTHLPPEAKDVPTQMERMVEWLNSRGANNLDPVIQAGVAHYEFVRIHPFIDGNGRTARVLASLVLLKRGFDTKRFFALDDFYNTDRNAYYKALQTVDPKKQDLTQWLEYFCEGVAVSIKAVEEKVVALTGDEGATGEGKQVALDYQQVKVVEYLQKNESTTNKEVRELLDVSHQRAYEVLRQLVELGVIEKRGRGRATQYILG